ncbi:hypothetical protein [Lichenifustis flavocetrariae]|uniref:VrrB protein n=1 Tax=Lichenifustis flavocetrariae TaxID=2949735 RepID=A0AA41YT22_9HYPH|nr:hypothetical protein [Lichenifustis flavocetrariae]MCW6506502.1 hypothetical protein [Lichenifustis flavocetrariae]
MRRWKAWIAGALAFVGLAAVQGEAQARPMTPPQLAPLHATQTEPSAAATEPTCYWHRGYRYGWHRHYGWRRHYGFHRRYGWRRPYGFYRHRSYRPVHYGWYRPWRYHRPYYGWHRHYGWRRW